LLLALVGCGAPEVPAIEQHAARCGDDARDKDRPMVVEWSAADRSAIEAESSHQLVVVAYENCHLRVLSDCGIPGDYQFTETTPARDFIEVKDENELHANLPLAAARFGAEVRAGNTLRLDYAVTGQRRANVRTVSAGELQGERCGEATHFVRAMIVGASTLSTQANTEASAEVDIAGAGGGGAHRASRRQLHTNGDLETCDGGDGSGCRALIQLDLTPISGRGGAAQPAGPSFEGVPQGATQLAWNPTGGGQVSGRLESGDRTLSSGEFADAHSVTVAAGASLRFLAASSEFDTYLIVRTPSGQNIDNDDGPGVGTNAAIEIPNAEAGTYTAVVTSFRPGEGGGYQLAVNNGSGQPGLQTVSHQGPPQPGAGGGQSNYGTISLAPGFVPDPHVARGESGGNLPAQNLGSGCAGYITQRPDHILALSGNSNFMRIYAVAQSDTTLVIRKPDGQYVCADDTYQLNPGVEGAMAAGNYQIWIGAYEPNVSSPYELYVTEIATQHP
jgi:hypothetical protein